LDEININNQLNHQTACFQQIKTFTSFTTVTTTASSKKAKNVSKVNFHQIFIQIQAKFSFVRLPNRILALI